MRVTRKMRFEYRMSTAAETRKRNIQRKNAERLRRDARMLRKIKSGNLPYTHDVMCWLSRKLDKPTSRISEDDVNSVIKSVTA